MRVVPARLLRARGLHFLLGGLLIHLAIGAQAPRPDPVSITPEAEARLRAGWVAATGREPSAAEFATELRRELDDEILFREALAAGMHLRDAVVRQRLVMNMRFLEPGTTDSDEALVVRAERLDMHLNDLVVRRRLVQLMEFALSDVPQEAPVSDAEARRMYDARAAELRLPARWRIRHVYFSEERRGADASREAVEVAKVFNTPGASADAGAMGDPFLGGRQLPLLTANQLEGQFGSRFTGALSGCEPSVWCAPVGSSFGQHAVLIEEFVPDHLPGLEEPSVRARIESDVRRARAAARLAQGLAALRLKYGADG